MTYKAILPLLKASRLAVLIAISLGLSSVASAQAIDTYEYTVREGDTCLSIAERELGGEANYRLIYQYNPNIGPVCDLLAPGNTLTLPRAPTVPDARVTAVRRQVQARQPTTENWRAANRGLGLFRGWRVNTLEQSAAELTFRDNSQVQMRENTLVIIYGGDGSLSRRQTTRAELERGTLRSRLGDLRMQVDTPSGDANLEGGNAVVSVDEEGTSRLSNHSGSASLRGEDGGEVEVRPGYGSRVRRGQRPTPPRPLPPAPSWVEGPRRFAGVASEGGVIRGSWEPVEDARVYRVEIRRTGETPVVAATEVQSNVTNFEVHRLPAGDYEVTLSTIDTEFFEGSSGQPEGFRVSLAEFDVPGEDEAQTFDPTAPPQTPSVLSGTALVAPDGVSCRIGDGEAAERITFDSAGTNTVTCENAEGELEPFEVEVATVMLERADGGNMAFAMVAGESTPIEIRSIGEVPDGAQWGAPDDIEIESIERDGDIWTITAVAQRAGDYVLPLNFGDTALSAVTLSAAEPEPEPEPEPEVAETPAPIGQEALSILRNPVMLGLRDTRGGNHAASIAIGNFGDTPFGSDSASQLTLSVEADIAGRGRIVVAANPEMSSFGRSTMYVGAGLHFRFNALTMYAELASYVPLYEAGSVILAPSISLGYELGDMLYFRTRQGALIGLEDGNARTWASAYGLDLRIVQGLFWGAEVDLGIGKSGDVTVTNVGVGLALGYALDFARVQVAVHRSLSNDLRQARGDWLITGGVRLFFPGMTGE